MSILDGALTYHCAEELSNTGLLVLAISLLKGKRMVTKKSIESVLAWRLRLKSTQYLTHPIEIPHAVVLGVGMVGEEGGGALLGHPLPGFGQRQTQFAF